MTIIKMRWDGQEEERIDDGSTKEKIEHITFDKCDHSEAISKETGRYTEQICPRCGKRLGHGFFVASHPFW